MIRKYGRPAGNRAAKNSIGGGFSSSTSLAPGTDSLDQRSPLRQALDAAIAEANGSKLSMKDLTVLAVQNDPFLIDSPAAHRDGEWLAIARFVPAVRRPKPSADRFQGLPDRRWLMTRPRSVEPTPAWARCKWLNKCRAGRAIHGRWQGLDMWCSGLWSALELPQFGRCYPSVGCSMLVPYTEDIEAAA
jgi:hypothetical protein